MTTAPEWDDAEPARTLTFLQLEEMQATREHRLPDYGELLDKLVAVCGSERRAMIAISRSAGIMMTRMAGDDAERIEDFLTMSALGGV